MFPSSPDVSLDFVSGNMRTLGKTKLTVSLGPCIQYIMIPLFFTSKLYNRSKMKQPQISNDDKNCLLKT